MVLGQLPCPLCTLLGPPLATAGVLEQDILETEASRTAVAVVVEVAVAVARL